MYSNTVFILPRKVDKSCVDSTLVHKKINNDDDMFQFQKRSQSYLNIKGYVELLGKHILRTSTSVYNSEYQLKDSVFIKCSQFLVDLEISCNETDLNAATGSATSRFGHVAFRDWFDKMKLKCREFVDNLAEKFDEQYREELYIYLSESFGNKMRIDYGTGHELNFIIFTMGLSNLVDCGLGDTTDLKVSLEKLGAFVGSHGWDIIALFDRYYLKLCRALQTKFRLEPAGSRGVYNMDDFQFMPFLLGAAQLASDKHISAYDFYRPDQVEQYKKDYIFFQAVDFIMNNKKGPFEEHSYTLSRYASFGNWSNISSGIMNRFTNDILGSFPIIQHFLFGKYILRWDEERENPSIRRY